MRQNYFILIIGLLLSTTVANAQWNLIKASDYSTAMSVINKDTIATIDYGHLGRIYYSHNGGQNWDYYQTPFVQSWFLDMHFPTSTVGYVCGGTNFGQYRNVILKTTDAGKTWDSLTTNAFTGYEFSDIHFVNADTGFVASPWILGKILKTTDGGQNFSYIDLPNSEIPTEIYFVPQNDPTSSFIGFVATRYYLNNQKKYVIAMHRTADLGNSWTTVFSHVVDDIRAINTINFADDTVGYAVGQNGLFLKTIDGGMTWIKKNLAPYTNLTGLFFTSPQVGYINNAGGIYKTTDGGQTWTVQNISPLGVIRGIAFANDTIGFAMGDTWIYKTTNAGGLHVEDYKKSPFDVYPNPVSDILYIQSQENERILSGCIYNNLGQKVKVFSKTKTINISELNTGLYFLRLKTTAGEFYEKIIVE